MNTEIVILFVILLAFAAERVALVFDFDSVKLVSINVPYQIKGANILLKHLTLIPTKHTLLLNVNPNKSDKRYNTRINGKSPFFCSAIPKMGKHSQNGKGCGVQLIYRASVQKKADYKSRLINKAETVLKFQSFKTYSFRHFPKRCFGIASKTHVNTESFKLIAKPFKVSCGNIYELVNSSTLHLICLTKTFEHCCFHVFDFKARYTPINVNQTYCDRRQNSMIDGKRRQLTLMPYQNSRIKQSNVTYDNKYKNCHVSIKHLTAVSRNKQLPEQSSTHNQTPYKPNNNKILSRSEYTLSANLVRTGTKTKSQTIKASPTGSAYPSSTIQDSRPQIKRYHANTQIRKAKDQQANKQSGITVQAIEQRKNRGTRLREIKTQLDDHAQNNGSTLKERRYAKYSTPMP